jgi:hypothetical protein
VVNSEVSFFFCAPGNPPPTFLVVHFQWLAVPGPHDARPEAGLLLLASLHRAVEHQRRPFNPGLEPSSPSLNEECGLPKFIAYSS